MFNIAVIVINNKEFVSCSTSIKMTPAYLCEYLAQHLYG
jgi:hypothetical protein